MRKLGLGILIGITILALSGIAVAVPNQTPREIDKIVFIHYPQGNVPYWSPVQAPAPTDQNTTYKYTGIHWAISGVQYAVNPSGVGAPDGAGAAIEASFDTWEAEPNSNIVFVGLIDTGETSLPDTQPDGYNVVSWENISTKYPGAIAVTIVWYYRGSKEIAEVDTIMNSTDSWAVNTGVTDPDSQTGASGAYDVQNIMTHEAGHWLMLLDLYQWKTQKLTMYGYGTTGELQKRTLGLGDKLGIDRIY